MLSRIIRTLLELFGSQLLFPLNAIVRLDRRPLQETQWATLVCLPYPDSACCFVSPIHAASLLYCMLPISCITTLEVRIDRIIFDGTGRSNKVYAPTPSSSPNQRNTIPSPSNQNPPILTPQPSQKPRLPQRQPSKTHPTNQSDRSKTKSQSKDQSSHISPPQSPLIHPYHNLRQNPTLTRPSLVRPHAAPAPSPRAVGVIIGTTAIPLGGSGGALTLDRDAAVEASAP